MSSSPGSLQVETTTETRPSAYLRLRWATRDCLLLTWRSLLRYARTPSLIVFVVVQPIMFVLLFRYVFGGAIKIPSGTYVDYLMPGIVCQTASFASIGTAVGLSEDLASGFIERLRSLPAARSALLIGRLASDLIRNCVTVILMIAIGYAVGFRFHNGALAALAMMALAVLFGLAIQSVAAWIGLTVHDTESVQGFGFIWLFPLTFASSAFVPVSEMPGWLQAFAKVNPVTLAVDTMRSLALGGPLATHFLETLAWMFGIAIVFVPLAVRSYRRAV